MVRFRLPQSLMEAGPARDLLFVSLGIVLFLLGADTLVERRPLAPRSFWALFDVLVHGVVALLIVFPIFGAPELAGRTTVLLYTILLTATMLDLDHFIAAGSLDLEGALQLATRPATHSLTFSAVVGLLGLLLSGNALVGWGLFAAMASHVLRDAAAGFTPIVWPLSLSSIPWWAYYPGEVLLLLISFVVQAKP